MVARTRWAGPPDRRVAAVLVLFAVTITSISAINAVRHMEDENAPRVIRSTGEVARAQGVSELAPARSATFLWVGLPHPDHPTGQLRWNGRPVDVRVSGGQVIVSGDGIPGSSTDISSFDYAREVYGVTARLAGTDQEWLALLVQLRATGRRELLLIFNPQGVLVHEELLEPKIGRVPRVGLGTAGPAGVGQEIVVDRGVPFRYHLSRR